MKKHHPLHRLLQFLVLFTTIVTSEESTTTPRTNDVSLFEGHSQTFLNINLQQGKMLPTTGFESDVELLMFKDCTLSVLPVGVFHAYSQLEVLYLNNSRVTVIDPGVFSGLTKLDTLYMDNNNITQISRGTLNSLTTLRVLNISYNSLTNIEVGSFSGLYNLQELNLSHNNLKSIDLTTLVLLTSLVHLDVSFNNLDSITPGYLDLQKLQKLFLNNNYFKVFPLSLVGNTTQLEKVDISFNLLNELNFNLFFTPTIANYSYNQISSVLGWENVNKAEIIDLSSNFLTTIDNKNTVNVGHLFLRHNKISVLPSGMFMGFKTLTMLDVSHNVVETMDVKAFKGLDNLLTLHINNNKIEEIPVGCFQELGNLVKINLSHNILKNIYYGTFTGLGHLQQLCLNSNNLKIVHENSLYVLKELEELSLRENNITTLDVLELVNSCPRLKKIDLNFNQFPCKNFLNITKQLEGFSIDFVRGDSFRRPNIFGVVCDDVTEYNTALINSTIISKDFSSCHKCFILAVVFSIIISISVVINVIGLTYQIFWKKREEDMKNSLEMKNFRTVVIDSKTESDNVYSNID